MQWVQDSNQSIVDNLTKLDVKLVDISGTKKKEHLKAKID